MNISFEETKTKEFAPFNILITVQTRADALSLRHIFGNAVNDEILSRKDAQVITTIYTEVLRRSS